MKFYLSLVSHGYEFNFPKGFICRDFANSYDDKKKLKLAAQIALASYFEDNFESDLDKVYKFLQDKRNGEKSKRENPI